MARPGPRHATTAAELAAMSAYVAATIPLIVEKNPTSEQVRISRNTLAQLMGASERRAPREARRRDKLRRRVLRLL